MKKIERNYCLEDNNGSVLSHVLNILNPNSFLSAIFNLWTNYNIFKK